MAVLIFATGDYAKLTQWLLATLVVLISVRTMLVGLLIAFGYHKLISSVVHLVVSPILYVCLILAIFPAMFVVAYESSMLWLLLNLAASFFGLLTVELLRKQAERQPA